MTVDSASRPLRVLLVTPRYPPYSGGVEHAVRETAARLAAAGTDVTVLTTDPTGELPARECADGVAVRRLRAYPRGRDYHLAPELPAAVRDGGWDLVHVHSYHTLVAPLAMWAAARAGIPFLLTFHGGGHSSALRRAARPAQRRLLRPLLARAARLVVLTPAEIPLYGGRRGLAPERFAVIPNGSDLPAVRPAAAPGAVVASVGRLERYKGHHRVLRALPAVLEARPDARLWIAGSGPYEPALRRLAARLGVADRVEIRAVPAGDRARMARELASVGVAVLLSDYETQPLAVLEALALGRPAVVRDAPGLRELGRAGLATTVSARARPAEVAHALLEALDVPSAPAPLSLPTWDDVAASTLQLYRDVLGLRTATTRSLACAS